MNSQFHTLAPIDLGFHNKIKRIGSITLRITLVVLAERLIPTATELLPRRIFGK